MSEPKQLPLPHDFPLEAPSSRVNVRKALAGLHMLNGEGSAFRCLMKAGYSRATARRLNGLSAKDCIDEAAKLDSRANPAKMLEAGRSRAMLAIESFDPLKVPLKDAMKMLDTVEKYYGGHEITPTNALTTVADRLGQLTALLALAQRRGLPVPRVQVDAQPFTEAVVVATASDSPKKETNADSLTIDGTTR